MKRIFNERMVGEIDANSYFNGRGVRDPDQPDDQ